MIKVQKIIISGEIDTGFTVNNVTKLEACRESLTEAYGPGFKISFIIQTDNFTDIQYPKNKRK